jgi:hypothetical protein
MLLPFNIEYFVCFITKVFNMSSFTELFSTLIAKLFNVSL